MCPHSEICYFVACAAHRIFKFFCDFFQSGITIPKGIFRTGAWHPLPNLNGCLGTRGTRSNKGPAIEKPYKIPTRNEKMKHPDGAIYDVALDT